MNIIGLETLVFNVDDIDACHNFLTDYGLKCCNPNSTTRRYEALDGTGVVIFEGHSEDFPRPSQPAPCLVETVYAVKKADDLDAIRAELEKDRQVNVKNDGSLHSVDDEEFNIAFTVSQRRPFDAPADLTNSPGHAPQRPANQPGISADIAALPRTLSHVVYFVNDAKRNEAFYERLGFRTTDSFENTGPFMRPAASSDHHCLFMIETPPFVTGCEHFTFHMGSGTEVMIAGKRFEDKGYQSFWGPGRHIFGSNWFWYFKSPLGCQIEYDADMDQHDDHWIARKAPIHADSSQAFLLSLRDNWAPGTSPR